MLNTIKKIATQTVKSMALGEIMEGEVVSAPPNLQIKLMSNEKLIIPAELIVVAEYLANHKRKITIKSEGKTELNSASISANITPAAPGPHTHSITNISLSSSNFELVEGEIEFLDELKPGDKVLVSSFSGGQKFFVFDRIVSYGGDD